MRAVIFVIIIAVIAALAALGSGYLHVNQVRPAQAPQVSASRNGVVTRGGQTPAFDVETGSVHVGTRSATVRVPDIRVEPANGASADPTAVNAVNHS